jgi:hypothetical protein
MIRQPLTSALLLLLCSLGTFDSSADTTATDTGMTQAPDLLRIPMHITGVQVSRTPRIHNDTIMFRLTLQTDTLAPNYYSYFDQVRDSLYLHFFDVQLPERSRDFTGQSPFTGMRTRTIRTPKAISGIRGVVAIAVDQTWHYRLHTPRPNTLHITLWRRM